MNIHHSIEYKERRPAKSDVQELLKTWHMVAWNYYFPKRENLPGSISWKTYSEIKCDYEGTVQFVCDGMLFHKPNGNWQKWNIRCINNLKPILKFILTLNTPRSQVFLEFQVSSLWKQKRHFMKWWKAVADTWKEINYQINNTASLSQQVSSRPISVAFLRRRKKSLMF